jgi:FtsZ-binding cell division protein ZapB
MNAQNTKKQKTLMSIDEKHTEILNNFNTYDIDTIPKLIQEIEELKTKTYTLHDNQIDTFLDIRDEILKKKAIIKNLKQQKKKYYNRNHCRCSNSDWYYSGNCFF